MMQPDVRLFRPIMGVRHAIIGILLVAYGITWVVIIPKATDRSDQFASICKILAIEAVLSAVLFYVLRRTRKALLVHFSLLVDIVGSTGLIMSTGYGGSLFQLFYVLIVVAAGLLYGQTIGFYYFLGISLANVLSLGLEYVDPMEKGRAHPIEPVHLIMGVALPVVAYLMLLVVKLTQRGLYLQALYENVSDGLLVLDDAGRIVEENGRVAQMTGRRRGELVGATLESLTVLGDSQAATIDEQFRRCLAGEAVSFEITLSRESGEPLPVEISAQSVSGLSPGRIQAFVRDISARRLMEAEIRRQNEELRRNNQQLQIGRDLALNASRLKTQFLANMSHELRTPLNSIIGYTQFVLDDRVRPLAEDQREDLGRVLRAARHLLDLINGVLDLARIESGRESVSISRFALGDLLDSVIDAVNPMAKGKGLTLDCHVEGGLPELETDEKKLRQILLNLLANAVKFTERGSVRIECRREASDFVWIIVSDTGIGIPPVHLDEIFSEFHQVDPSIHKQYGGTGLGLAIVKRLVELLKGTIGVESFVGSGSTFTVVIPLTLSMSHDAAGSITVVTGRSGQPQADAGPVGVMPNTVGTLATES